MKLNNKSFFPIIGSIGSEDHGGKGIYMNDEGIKLRQYYAGLAMQGYLASYAGASKDPDAKNVAAKAIEYADALIAELEK